jgi:prolyl-tRNA editing enzyme YbaK/EbsC (Cys-tRNA(Pro) deacylase)
LSPVTMVSASPPPDTCPTMPDDALNLPDFLVEEALEAQIVAPGVPMPTVGAAAAAMGVSPEQIFKSLLFQAPAGRCVLVVACGNARVDVKRVEGFTGIVDLKLAKPEVVLAKTGYPAGGTPPVGHRERFPVVVDARVAAQDWGYAGGGRPEYLVKIRSVDIIRLTNAMVADVIAKNR